MTFGIEEAIANSTPPLSKEQFTWTVGTRPVPASEWLTIETDRSAVLAEKDRLHEVALSDVVVSLDDQDEVADELLSTVVHYLTTHHDETFKVIDNDLVDNETGRTVDISHRPSIEVVSRTVADDFAIMRKIDDEWVMTAGAVCFTSRWDLRSKLGKGLTAIHDPIPHYEQRLDRAVISLFDRLASDLDPDKVLCRTSWTVVDTDERHMQFSLEQRMTPGDLRFIRLERQTIRWLPINDAIVFTIGTSITALADLSEQTRTLVLAAINRADEDIRTYKSWP